MKIFSYDFYNLVIESTIKPNAQQIAYTKENKDVLAYKHHSFGEE